MTENATLPVGLLVDAARNLANAGRWERATTLLDAAFASLPQGAAGRGAAARVALATAEIAVDSGWFTGVGDAAARLSKVDEFGLDPAGRWDLDFAWLRYEYRESFGRPDRNVRRRAQLLAETAPDPLRLGWAHMYLGLVADNLFDEREAAPAHYEIALHNSAGDDLLRREAQRHLGDHDHDRGDHDAALSRWRDATEAGARAGAVPGTLSQQMLLAVLARDAGDEAGATALAGEVARWATAIGAARTAAQATAFLDGVDPTQPPPAPGTAAETRFPMISDTSDTDRYR
ncbi:hypothetical protein [Dactylosporangium sp. NPDC048998]|uniref:hypothetical protein n=1 Tax=Dactylosporangium sp. NPDC048998 TaxID=3363976 RepID=UPI00371D57AA